VIAIGVDGARFRDALSIEATDVETGYQWTAGLWERPKAAEPSYEHPKHEVDAVMVELFRRFDPWRAYVDPQYIEHLVDLWQGRWGDDRVIPWHTNRDKPIAYAVRNYTTAIGAADFRHDGHQQATEHIRQRPQEAGERVRRARAADAHDLEGPAGFAAEDGRRDGQGSVVGVPRRRYRRRRVEAAPLARARRPLRRAAWQT
jgi:hypothetical protein